MKLPIVVYCIRLNSSTASHTRLRYFLRGVRKARTLFMGKGQTKRCMPTPAEAEVDEHFERSVEPRGVHADACTRVQLGSPQDGLALGNEEVERGISTVHHNPMALAWKTRAAL